MANRNIYNLGMYAATCVAGIWGWNYYQDQNRNLTIDEKYEKYGGDKRRLVEQRVQNALMFKKIKEQAGIKEKDLPKAPETETQLVGRMEGRKNEDVLAERKKLKAAQELAEGEEEKPVKKTRKKKKRKTQEETEDADADGKPEWISRNLS